MTFQEMSVNVEHRECRKHAAEYIKNVFKFPKVHPVIATYLNTSVILISLSHINA